MGGCATQTTLIDVVHGAMCTCALLTPLTFTQCWIHERCGSYQIQFRSKSVCRLPFRREPVVDLTSQGPGRWGQHDNWVQLTLQRPGEALQPLILRCLKSNLGLAAAPPPEAGPGPHQPPRASVWAQLRPSPGGRGPAPTTWHPPALRPAGDSLSRAQPGLAWWVGDPTTGSPGLTSPPVGGPQPLVQQRRPLRRSPLCSGNHFCPVETSCLPLLCTWACMWFATELRCFLAKRLRAFFCGIFQKQQCLASRLAESDAADRGEGMGCWGLGGGDGALHQKQPRRVLQSPGV
jgi:hypothetical protein